MPLGPERARRAGAHAASVSARRLAGHVLHSLFEELDFTQPVSEEWVLKMLQSGGYDAQWQLVLTEWIRAVLHAPLTVQGSR